MIKDESPFGYTYYTSKSILENYIKSDNPNIVLNVKKVSPLTVKYNLQESSLTNHEFVLNYDASTLQYTFEMTQSLDLNCMQVDLSEYLSFVFPWNQIRVDKGDDVIISTNYIVPIESGENTFVVTAVNAYSDSESIVVKFVKEVGLTLFVNLNIDQDEELNLNTYKGEEITLNGTKLSDLIKIENGKKVLVITYAQNSKVELMKIRDSIGYIIRDLYCFDTICTDSTLEQLADDFIIQDNTSLFVKWQDRTFAWSYDQSIKYNDYSYTLPELPNTITASQGTIDLYAYIPTREHYEFIGWYNYFDVKPQSGTDYDYKNYNFVAANPVTQLKIEQFIPTRDGEAVITPEIILVARFAPISYTRTISYGIGVCDGQKSETITFTIETAKDINWKVPTVDGYTFNGYYTKEGSTYYDDLVAYLSGGKWSTKPTLYQYTAFYANYQVITYNLYYYSIDASKIDLNSKTFDIVYIDSATKSTSFTIEDSSTIPTLILAGYEFLGMYTQPYGKGTKVDTIEKGTNNNIYLYPHFVLKNLTFNLYFRYAYVTESGLDYFSFGANNSITIAYDYTLKLTDQGKEINFAGIDGVIKSFDGYALFNSYDDTGVVESDYNKLDSNRITSKAVIDFNRYFKSGSPNDLSQNYLFVYNNQTKYIIKDDGAKIAEDNQFDFNASYVDVEYADANHTLVKSFTITTNILELPNKTVQYPKFEKDGYIVENWYYNKNSCWYKIDGEKEYISARYFKECYLHWYPIVTFHNWKYNATDGEYKLTDIKVNSKVFHNMDANSNKTTFLESAIVTNGLLSSLPSDWKDTTINTQIAQNFNNYLYLDRDYTKRLGISENIELTKPLDVYIRHATEINFNIILFGQNASVTAKEYIWYDQCENGSFNLDLSNNYTLERLGVNVPEIQNLVDKYKIVSWYADSKCQDAITSKKVDSILKTTMFFVYASICPYIDFVKIENGKEVLVLRKILKVNSAYVDEIMTFENYMSADDKYQLTVSNYTNDINEIIKSYGKLSDYYLSYNSETQQYTERLESIWGPIEYKKVYIKIEQNN